MTARTERRRAHRARPHAELRMSLDGHAAPARVRDLSSSGVSCTTDRPLPVLSQVRLVLVLPDGRASREVSCTGAVVRCVRDRVPEAPSAAATSFETAIFFTDLRETDRTAIDELVTTLRGAGQVA